MIQNGRDEESDSQSHVAEKRNDGKFTSVGLSWTDTEDSIALDGLMEHGYIHLYVYAHQSGWK